VALSSAAAPVDPRLPGTNAVVERKANIHRFGGGVTLRF